MNNSESKTTLIIGASENPERYSNMAIRLLKSYGHSVRALGRKNGMVDGIKIETDSNCENFSHIDTISLYINPFHQAEFANLITCIKPKRVIFNPGTENDEMTSILDSNNIEWEEACTLVLLRSGQY